MMPGWVYDGQGGMMNQSLADQSSARVLASMDNLVASFDQSMAAMQTQTQIALMPSDQRALALAAIGVSTSSSTPNAPGDALQSVLSYGAIPGGETDSGQTLLGFVNASYYSNGISTSDIEGYLTQTQVGGGSYLGDTSSNVKRVIGEANGNLMALRALQGVAASFTSDSGQAFYGQLSAAMAPLEAQNAKNYAFAESQVNQIFGGFLALTAGAAGLVTTAPTWLPALGYEGSLSTMGGSLGVKATIGLTSEWGANAVTGQEMTFSKGAGAVAGSIIFAPAVGKLLPEGTSLLTNLMVTGGAAGGGGNFVEQSIDRYTTGTKFSGSGLLWSTAFGTLGGLTGWANMKMLPAPLYINPIGNSLLDDIVKAPAAVGAVPALVAQKIYLAEPAGAK
jgi:hypothetical protein